MSGSRRAGSPGQRAPRPTAADKIRLQQELAARRRRERRTLVAVALGLVLLVVGGIGVQAWRANRAPSATRAPAAGAAVAVTDGQPLVFGPADAPVTVRLYEDFHCPHCADFEEEFGPVLTEAQSAGQAKVAFFPMSFIDAGSTSAANAMACAAESGFGPAYAAGLFANSTLAWDDDQLLDLAGQVSGSVPEDFPTCVGERRHAGWVESITAAAAAAGVTGTPTMFIDDQPVDIGSLTPEALRTRLADAARR